MSVNLHPVRMMPRVMMTSTNSAAIVLVDTKESCARQVRVRVNDKERCYGQSYGKLDKPKFTHDVVYIYPITGMRYISNMIPRKHGISLKQHS